MKHEQSYNQSGGKQADIFTLLATTLFGPKADVCIPELMVIPNCMGKTVNFHQN